MVEIANSSVLDYTVFLRMCKTDFFSTSGVWPMPSSKTFIETSFSWKCQQQPPVSGSPGEADTPGVPRAARILNGLRLKENYVTFSGKCYRQPPASRSTGEARQLYPVDQGWLARQGLQGGAVPGFYMGPGSYLPSLIKVIPESQGSKGVISPRKCWQQSFVLGSTGEARHLYSVDEGWPACQGGGT